MLIVLAAGLYAPTLGFDFVYEDQRDLPTLFRAFEWSDLWQKPARSLTALTFALTPLDAGVQHAVNLALHLVNVALLCALAFAVSPFWPALFVGAAFALHPIQVEAVAYVSSRPDLLATACVLLALHATSAARWFPAFLACALAVASKEIALVAFGLVPLWCWHRGLRPPIWLVMLWSVGVVAVLAYFVARYPLQIDLLAVGNTVISLVDLLGRIAVPVGLTIDPDWRWSQPMQIAGVALLMLTPLCLPPRSGLAFAAAWVLLCVSPRLLVPLGEGLHAHHLYLPMVGIALGVSAHGSRQREFPCPSPMAPAA